MVRICMYRESDLQIQREVWNLERLRLTYYRLILSLGNCLSCKRMNFIAEFHVMLCRL